MIMIRCASLYTYEIDSPENALEELKTQLDEKITLLEHSVGIIMCHPDFIGTGVLKHISENLPFDSLGVTTSAQAVNDTAGELILTVFVISSDSVRFKVGMTEDLEDDIDAPLKEAYDEASKGISETPGLALVFLPLLLKYAGDAYVDAWRRITPNTPVFGTIAIDDSITFEGSRTIFKGESYRASMPFLLCYGDINPRFLVGTLPEDKAMPYRGEITKSHGPYVKEINNCNAYQYFESIGFARDGTFAEMFILVPFVIDQKGRADYDGVPVMRGHAAFTENGTAIFRGAVDEGSTFTMLKSGPDDVLTTTRQKIGQINNMDGVNGALMFPCIARQMMTMRKGPVYELEAAKDVIDHSIPFMMGYAGGEVCPTSVRDGTPTNRFHNYSLVILVI